MNSVQYFLALRGNQCENCGEEFEKYNPPTRHHCIEKRIKDVIELDSDINIELVCNNCHVGTREVDTPEHAIEFAIKQIERGYDVLGWYRELPLKTRRFPNLEKMINV